jgi:voltage-gated potassium channel Kch
MVKTFSRPQRNLIWASVFVLVVMVVFAVGYRIAGWSWADAFYMVVITAFSVGFGEVVPIDSPGLRLWTVGLILFGCTGIIFVTGSLVQWLTEAQIQRVLGGKRMQQDIEKLKHHAIICGYGRIGRMLAHQLREGTMAFVVLDQSTERIAEAREDGFFGASRCPASGLFPKHCFRLAPARGGASSGEVAARRKGKAAGRSLAERGEWIDSKLRLSDFLQMFLRFGVEFLKILPYMLLDARDPEGFT